MDKKEVGADGALTVSGYEGDVPVTNVSYSLDTDTSDSQYLGNLRQSIAITGVSYSGSFEYDGSNDELREKIRDSDGLPRVLDQLLVQESKRNVLFKNVIVEGASKDIPGDDRTSMSYDFVAEKSRIIEK